MKKREKILAAVLVAGALAIWGLPFLEGLFFGGLRNSRARLADVERAAEKVDKQVDDLVAASHRLGESQGRSLPPDPAEAELLYQEWLTDLAQIAGLNAVHVIPQPPAPITNAVFATVRITVKAEATFEQLAVFLQDFRRVDLLHRIAALKVESPKNPGGLLKIEATAEGLCLRKASPRMPLFPRTKLADSLPRSFDSLKVASAEEFPKEAGFDARVEKELVTVTKLTGENWSVKRGAEGTSAVRHAPKTEVELFPIRSDRKNINWEAQRRALAVHPFVRPIPTRPPDPNDAARQTRLMASIDVGDERAAWLENKSTRRRTRLSKGTPINVGDVQGVVVSVEPTYVQIRRGSEIWELKFGNDLKSMTRVETGSDDGDSSDSDMDASPAPRRENRGSGGRQRNRSRSGFASPGRESAAPR